MRGKHTNKDYQTEPEPEFQSATERERGRLQHLPELFWIIGFAAKEKPSGFPSKPI